MRKAKATQLRDIAAKVRQVAGACSEKGYWKGCAAIGPLFKEAYEAGAWQSEGSQIGDRLKRIRADRQELWTDGQSPAWTLDAYFAVVEPLTSHLMPPAGGKEQLKLEAGIAADEIEEEAKRIEARRDEGSPPDELLAELSGTEQRIVSYLWNRPKVRRSTFVNAIYKGKANTPDAEEKAIRRLQSKFYKLRSNPKLKRYSDIRIELRADYVTFDRRDE